MCTVTYIPTGSQRFILTSNRDENPGRGTETPSVGCTISEEEYLVFPKDQKAGGTWIAMSPLNRMICLLNGAFVKHKHEPPYRRSRGLVALDYFGFPDAQAFVEGYDLTDIEPFNLIMVEPVKIWELKWDGGVKHFRELDKSRHYIWSSATLYSPEVVKAKEEKFFSWLEENHYTITPQQIQQFQGLDNAQGYLLDLPMVKTVSITCVVNDGESAEMTYNDLLSRQQFHRKITFAHHQEIP